MGKCGNCNHKLMTDGEFIEFMLEKLNKVATEDELYEVALMFKVNKHVKTEVRWGLEYKSLILEYFNDGIAFLFEKCSDEKWRGTVCENDMEDSSINLAN